jgi:uncharacterized protein with HEPN domain
MARDISAYLCDIIDACDSIASILAGISFETFVATREKRSAVEREFILIGEATSVLAKFWPDSFKLLSDGRKAIGFRNILTHNYASVDQETVYETALQDVPKLRRECVEILRETDEAVNNGRGNSPGAD